ncbi:MAG: S41 family peptidase [Coriobacteriia bacterium]|nr:S41 family peptidase [Coriobacteriia bacterium]
MNRYLTIALGVIIAMLLLASTFVGGFALGRTMEGPIPGVTTADSPVGEKVDEVRRLLDFEALSPSSETSATNGAISGLLEANGDKYAVYFDAETYKLFSEQTDGEFFGIGVTIAEKDGKVYLVSIIDGTPAAKAGLKADDVIVAVNGKKLDPPTSETVVKAVRGPEGTSVSLTIERPSEDGKDYTLSIKRARIDIPNVMSKIMGPSKNVGYIAMGSFNAKSQEDMAAAIADLQEQGAKTLILDLRNDPGGLLQEAVDVASLFIDDGVIVRVEERDTPEKEMRANRLIPTLDVPLVVLVNENSASASEVLGGALQDYDRAKLVGTKTFGKGSVQTIEELTFGGAVKFTTAHYLTPKSRVIDGVGLTPDVVVEMKVELMAKPETDTQLKRAIDEAIKQLR